MATLRIGNNVVVPVIKETVGIVPSYYPELEIDSNGKLKQKNMSTFSAAPATDLNDCVFIYLSSKKTSDASGANIITRDITNLDFSTLNTISGKYALYYAFSANTGLASIDLSNLTTISGYQAMNACFYGCTGLTSVDLSNLTTVSGYGAMGSSFRDCTALTSINLSSLTTVSGESAMQDCFYYCKNLTSADLSNLTEVSGKSAMQECFYNCTNLTSVDLSGLTTLSGQYGMQDCFAGCSSLTSINLSSLTTVNNQGAMIRCFNGCTGLTSVDLSGLTTLSGMNTMQYCFQGCRSLTSVDLSSITSISGNSVVAQCFSGCSSLTTVTIGNANQEISFDLPNTNQLSAMLTGCSQNITLNIATSQATLSQLSGYPNFGCTGTVTIRYLTDCQVTPNITGTWTSITVNGQTFDSSTTSFSIPKNIATTYVITTPNGIYVGKIPAQSGTTYMLTVDLTSVTYDAITLQPDTTTTFIAGNITIAGATKALSAGALSANVYNASGDTLDVSYLYVQAGYKPATGTTTYSSGALNIPLTMVVGTPVWVESVSGQQYPWRVAETVTAPAGYQEYESTNWHVDNSSSVSKLCFYGTDFTCYINSYAEGNYDFTIISQADATTIPTSESGAKASTKGNQKDPSVFPANYTQVDYTGLTDALHYVYIVYKKDNSSHTANDRGYVVF